jgi:hypothetical protein
MFFDRPDLDLAQAAPGTYALAPSPAMLARLVRDYENMAAMFFGPIRVFDDLMSSVAELERQLSVRRLDDPCERAPSRPSEQLVNNLLPNTSQQVWSHPS